MSQYVITIVRVADDGFSGPASQIVVHIDADGVRPTVTELTMRAPEGGGLAATHLPYVDMEMLIGAFLPAADAAPKTSMIAGRAEPADAASRPPAKQSGSTKRTASARARAAGAKPSHLGAGRAYRKAPQMAELEDVYLQTGTIAGVAEHFDVPVHTAQGWITRMRRKSEELSS